ncbi:TetR/AcrR family transcriptional regulator [Streptomyces sp. NPDC021224]|uniref:TetR/AcrR family transcriptional regulator n=1 Tax=unclassified Streptomyces TaxID=2593676 RepID=UPI0037A57B67
MSEADEKPRRRQARGERRVTQLLKAAASVFCAVGYTASSTNAIAREAGVSPGTLYQFFPNKEAIAVELGSRLIGEMEETHGRVFTAANARLPLDQLVDAVADPFIEFNCANPAFFSLIKGSDTPGQVADEHDTLHATLLDRVAWVLALRRPSLSSAERTVIAQMSFATFKAGLELILLTEDDTARAAYARELKSMLSRYLAPHVGTGPVEIGEEEKAAARSSLAAAGAIWFDGPPQDVAYLPASGTDAGPHDVAAPEPATPPGPPTGR